MDKEKKGPVWTKDQQSAIDSRNRSVLVSAAAGSGKTAVLLERVCALLKEGMRLDRLLVVTFTRATAAEMREKLMRKLEESDDPVLEEQAMLVNRAEICTLHVFCSKVIRDYFQASGIDPTSRVPDTAILDRLWSDAADEVLEAAYLDPSPDEQALFSSFTDTEVLGFMTSLRRFLLSLESSEDWISKAYEHQNTGYWLELSRNAIPLLLSRAGGLLDQCESLLARSDAPAHYGPALESDQRLLDTITVSVKNGTFDPDTVSYMTLPRAKKGAVYSDDLADEYQKVRKSFKDLINSLDAYYPKDTSHTDSVLADTLPQLRALVRLATASDMLFSEKKRKKNYIDYPDMEQLCLKCLADERVRREISESYDAVFVDEYQDISAVQEAIIKKVLGKNTLLFMVGDIKQSIYRFRLAEPSLFRNKYHDFSSDPDADERKIVLQQNFRSTENILHCVNTVFSHAMRESVTELEYDEKAMLYPKPSASFGPDTELCVLLSENGDPDTELKEGYRYEAAFMADEISRLIQNGMRDENGIAQNVRYRDIVILLRKSSGRAPALARTLSDRGIPVYCDADARFYDLPEVNDILSLLTVLDDPLQDIPLIAALHCPCFDFSMEELSRIRMRDPSSKTPFRDLFEKASHEESELGEKIRKTQKTLSEWRFLAGNMPVDALIRQVTEKSGLYMRAGAMKDGALRQANMRMLYEQAENLEDPWDLSEFLRGIRQARTQDDTVSAKSIGENEDVVRIMTIHKSKGLQFPIVFISGLAEDFHRETAPLQLSASHGMAIACIDGEKRVKRENLALSVLKEEKKQEERAEECRLLYVAMTRAEQKLYLVCAPKKASAQLSVWQRPREDYAAGDATCMADWIGQSIREGLHENLEDTRHTDVYGGKWQIRWIPAREAGHDETAAPPDENQTQQPVSGETLYYMKRIPRGFVPLKTSVTALAKHLMDENDMEETPPDKRKTGQREYVPSFITENDRQGGLLRGTATHKALGSVDYDLIRAERWEDALERLYAKGMLTEQEYSLIKVNWLEHFFTSDLGKRALQAPLVHREWAFNLLLDTGTILQGVIDLCFTEGDGWILTDYKTDRVNAEELKERYSSQLNWYRRALEKITGMPVKEMYLFSLSLGEAIPVTPFDDQQTNVRIM